MRGGGRARSREGEPAAERRWMMRKVLLALVLAGASLGLIGLTPSKAEAQWRWRRGYVTS